MNIKVKHVATILGTALYIYLNYLMINIYFFSNISEEDKHNSPIPLLITAQIVIFCVILIACICENWDKTITNTNKFKL